LTQTPIGTGVSLTVATLVVMDLVLAGAFIPAPPESGQGQPWAGHLAAAAEQFVSPLSAANGSVNVTGYDTAAVSLSWGTSAGLPGAEYEIEESTNSSNGPWASITNWSPIGSVLVPGFLPGEVVWFQDVYTDLEFHINFTSAPVRVTLADNASLVRSDSSSSAVRLSWTNNADYGGLIGFQSYRVEERVNDGQFFIAATLTNVSNTTYVVSGLSGVNTGSVYSFYILTTDVCEPCGSYLINSTSNTVTATPAPAVGSPQGPSTLDYGIIGVVVAVGAIGVVAVLWRRREKASPNPMMPQSGAGSPPTRP
jgi:hypothetical protein